MDEVGMVAYVCNSSTWEVKEEYCEFQASLGYIRRPCERGEEEERKEGKGKGRKK
jgi:hypothetical protein